MKKQKTIAFAGGGSAGHIYPLVAVALAYKELHPKARVIFVGGKSDKAWIPKGVFDKCYAIESGKLHRYITLDLLKQPGKVFAGWKRARQILENEEVEAVFCKGGFTSLPTALAAHWIDIPVYAHETDSVPGLANKVVAKFAKNIFTAFPTETYAGTLPLAKCIETGQPVRAEFMAKTALPAEVQLGKEAFPLGRPYVLVTGGSQGAMRLNTLASSIWGELTHTHRVVHVTGDHDFQRMKELHGLLAQGVKEKVFVVPKVTEHFAELVRGSDIVFTRAGGTLWELLAAQKMMVLVPLSTSASNHQQRNADVFVGKKWATSVNEVGEGALASLREAIRGLPETRPVSHHQKAAETIAKLLP